MAGTPIQFTVPGEARGKARIRTGHGKFFMDDRTRDAEAWVRVCAMPHRPPAPLDGALAVSITVACLAPASWSAKRRAAALEGTLRPTTRPDVDNIAKSVLDPLNGLLWRDDAQVAELTVARWYAEAAEMVVTVRAL